MRRRINPTKTILAALDEDPDRLGLDENEEKLLLAASRDPVGAARYAGVAIPTYVITALDRYVQACRRARQNGDAPPAPPVFSELG